MKVPLSKPSITSSELKNINSSIKSGWLTHGQHNKTFEELFKKKFKIKYALSLNSCTSALEIAVKCLKKKGEIILPSFTWVSSANAIINCGCTPVFVDIDFNSKNIDPKKIEKKISKNTVAIMVVHFGGLPCEMKPIIEICKRYRIELIEDSAETLGATYNKKYTGSFGTGCFSFFPTKNITTTEGGMITFKDKGLYEKAKLLIAHGIDKKLKKKPWHRVSSIAGHNFRLPNHLALLGISQFKKLKNFNSKRRKIAKIYDKAVLKYNNFFIPPKYSKKFTHSYQMYSITCDPKYRDNLVKFFNKNGIEASVHFDPPLHQQNYLKKYIKKKDDFLNTNRLSRSIITLPMYPDLKMKEINYILNVIDKWYIKTIK